MKLLLLTLASLLPAFAAIAAEMQFDRPTTLQDGTEIISQICSINDAASLAKYQTNLQKIYGNADPRVIRPQVPKELSEIVVIQISSKGNIKLWSHILPKLKSSERESELLPRPRAIFLVPETSRLLLIWQSGRKLLAKELEKNTKLDDQLLPISVLTVLEPNDTLNIIGNLDITKTGELLLSIDINGIPSIFRRSNSKWEKFSGN